MKTCRNCGYISEDDSVSFCRECGNVMESDAENTIENPAENFSFVTSEENQQETYDSEGTPAKKSKKNLFLLIGIPVIAVVLVIAIVCCSVFVFGKGPVAQISKAAAKTLKAESFTVKVKVDDENLKCKIVLDYEKKDINLLISDDDENVTGIYDGYFFNVYEYKNDMKGYKDNVSDEIEMFFDEWENSEDIMKNGDVNWDKVFEMLDDLDTGIDRDDVEEHIYLDKMSDALKEMFKLLNDEDWLEECMNYEKNKEGGVTYHSFDIDFSKTADTVEDVFSDCTKSSEADDVLDMLVDNLDDMDDDDFSVKAKVGIKRGYLHEAEVKVSEDSDSYKLKFEFSEVGSTKIDEKELQEYLDICNAD